MMEFTRRNLEGLRGRLIRLHYTYSYKAPDIATIDFNESRAYLQSIGTWGADQGDSDFEVML